MQAKGTYHLSPESQRDSRETSPIQTKATGSPASRSLEHRLSLLRSRRDLSLRSVIPLVAPGMPMPFFAYRCSSVFICGHSCFAVRRPGRGYRLRWPCAWWRIFFLADPRATPAARLALGGAALRLARFNFLRSALSVTFVVFISFFSILRIFPRAS